MTTLLTDEGVTGTTLLVVATALFVVATTLIPLGGMTQKTG